MLRCNDLNALYFFHTPNNADTQTLSLSLEAQEGKKSFNMFSWLTLKELINPQWDAVRSKTGLFVVEQELL